MLASEYGYTFEEIGSLTMREVDWALKQISKRTRRKVAIDASLHGVKLNIEEEIEENNVKFAPEVEANIDKYYQEAFRRKAEKRRG